MEIGQEEGERTDEGDSESDPEETEDESENAFTREGEEDVAPGVKDPPPASDHSDVESKKGGDDSEADDSPTSEEDPNESRAARKARKAAKPKQPTRVEKDVKATVSSELTRQRARQDRRYHSKKSVGKAGRAKGSKMKSDTRVKITGGGDGWD